MWSCIYTHDKRCGSDRPFATVATRQWARRPGAWKRCGSLSSRRRRATILPLATCHDDDSGLCDLHFRSGRRNPARLPESVVAWRSAARLEALTASVSELMHFRRGLDGKCSNPSSMRSADILAAVIVWRAIAVGLPRGVGMTTCGPYHPSHSFQWCTSPRARAKCISET